ncbi:unnamed protein product [Leptidea sinapis]|uniref:Vanin C-terminal domain-containing protein n=1 Tax=Leptidea sinapis TaxID=189913 RepID=A0A5E4QBW2_9NEOP|nr:unnamed protein product [Leptidea sinapis]
MRSVISLCVLCMYYAVGEEVYTVAVLDPNSEIYEYGEISRTAKNGGADILVIPTQHTEPETRTNSYDKTLKELSTAAKEERIYIVANLYNSITCQNRRELSRHNVVFNRNGAIVTISKKSTHNCNDTQANMVSFATDFGVKFGVMAEEDMVLHDVRGSDIRNYVVLGPWSATTLFLSGEHFTPVWAFATKSNVISQYGVYGSSSITRSGNNAVAVLNKNGNDDDHITTYPVALSSLPGEDLSNYVIKPLDLVRGSEGYQESVCHESFCCGFDVKTTVNGNINKALSFGLTAYDGLLDVEGHRVGTQICAVIACAGLYKRSCLIQAGNTSVIFDKLTISANFSVNTEHYPSILTSTESTKHILFQKNFGNNIDVKTIIHNADNLLRIGIFGRDYRKDFIELQNIDTEYISNENVEEFFDYLWIRLRVLIFVVSIYILEMM